MKENDKDLTPEKSLQLIASMIETTKNTISDSSHYFLLWGWAVCIGCFLHYYLKVIAEFSKYYYSWWVVTPIAIILHLVFVYRDAKKTKVKTYINEANAYLWTAICLSFVSLSFVFTKIGWQYSFPFYITFYSVGTFVSGSLIKFKPLIVGGLIGFGLVIVSAFSSYNMQILITAVSILISYIIPGYWLRNEYRKQRQFAFD